MKLYNTLTKKIEEIIPYEKGVIRLYTCGPTVYSDQHLGNMRTYTAEDVLEKALTYLGFNVKRAMNITDVGHLQSDGDVGEDKMSIAIKREHKSSKEIANYYIDRFFEDCEILNIKKPEIISKATENINQYIKIIEKLIRKDTAYISEGNVYFDTSKVPNYYELSGKNQDDLYIAVREGIEEDRNKRNVFDFGLWFTNSKFKNPELTWDSPWGKGYPGWHIECSGIAIKYLGEHLDIHCGAEDAVFPHHSNEIAQSEAYLGHKWCSYWIHLAWLNNKGGFKLSKSKGDTLRASNLINLGYNPLSFRYYVLGTHYHKQVNFSFESLDIADSAYKKLKNKIKNIKDDNNFNIDDFNKYDLKFKEALEDDLNTSNTITLLYDLLKDDNISGATKIKLIESWDKVFSLDLLKIEENKKHKNHEYIMKKINERNQAKKDKNFELADKIREELLEKNILLIDTKEGTIYEVKE